MIKARLTGEPAELEQCLTALRKEFRVKAGNILPNRGSRLCRVYVDLAMKKENLEQDG